MKPKVICKGCRKTPEELEEYINSARIAGMTPTEVVIQDDGTYNRFTGLFLCDKCYLESLQNPTEEEKS